MKMGMIIFMSSFPQYTGPENLRRIAMQSRQKFILVEGPFDLPIYDELLKNVAEKYSITNEKIILFGGGKQNILAWLSQRNRNNVSIILDMDFDYGNYQSHRDSIFELKKYSIENYFFDNDVVSPLISSIFKVTIDDVKRIFNLEELLIHWRHHIESLIPVIYYYQMKFNGDKSKWSNTFICDDRNYTLCCNKIDNFKSKLLEEMNIDENTCITEYRRFISERNSSDTIFPGKLLLVSFYRYLKNYCNSLKDKAFSPITSPESLVYNLSPRLINNRELENIVYSALVH